MTVPTALKWTSPKDAMRTPKAIQSRTQSRLQVNYSVPRVTPMTKTIAGMKALSICTYDTCR